MSKALDDIAAERQRQIDVEGWRLEDDDMYAPGKLARAGASYAAVAFLPMEEKLAHKGTLRWMPSFCGGVVFQLWPFLGNWFKPTTARRDLVKAGALIVAEIERMDREESAKAAA